MATAKNVTRPVLVLPPAVDVPRITGTWAIDNGVLTLVHYIVGDDGAQYEIAGDADDLGMSPGQITTTINALRDSYDEGAATLAPTLGSVS